MNYHETLADVKRFIVWYATNEPDVSDWDKTRYADAVAMVRAIDSLHSRTPSDGAVAILCEVAFARMWMLSDNQSNLHRWNIMKLYSRFSTGERTLSLLREMERVTGELTGGEK